MERLVGAKQGPIPAEHWSIWSLRNREISGDDGEALPRLGIVPCHMIMDQVTVQLRACGDVIEIVCIVNIT